MYLFCFYTCYLPFLPSFSNVAKEGRNQAKSCILIGTALSANKTFCSCFMGFFLFFAEKLPENSICADVMNEPRNGIGPGRISARTY